MRLLPGDGGLPSARVLPRLFERVQHLLDRSIMPVTLAANIVGLLSVSSHFSGIITHGCAASEVPPRMKYVVLSRSD